MSSMTRATVIPIGVRMREARQAAEMTQKAVARRLFVTPATIRCWEAGRRMPGVEMLDAYLCVVGASITLGVAS